MHTLNCKNTEGSNFQQELQIITKLLVTNKTRHDISHVLSVHVGMVIQGSIGYRLKTCVALNLKRIFNSCCGNFDKEDLKVESFYGDLC